MTRYRLVPDFSHVVSISTIHLACLFFLLSSSFVVLGQKSNSKITDKNFSGSWYWENKDHSNSFYLYLRQQHLNVRGYYCASVNHGKRIDCDDANNSDFNVEGKIVGDSCLVTFNSFFDGIDGKASLTIIGDQLVWKMIKNTRHGPSYAPLTAVLANKK